MNYERYLQTAICIIKRFDVIAPYEKYSGGSEKEFSFFMNDIRTENTHDNSVDDDLINNEKATYANQLVQQSNETINMEDAIKFVEILHLYSVLGKDDTLIAFDEFVDNIVKKYEVIPSVAKVSFFMSVLNANGVITQNELDCMKENFTNEIIKTIIQDQ